MVRVLLVLVLLASIVVPLIPHEEVYADGGVFVANYDAIVANSGSFGDSYGVIWNASTGSSADSGIDLVGQGCYFSGGNNYYVVERGALYFDTSSIPDGATLSSGVLQVCVAGDRDSRNTQGRYFNLTIQNGQPTYPHNPIAKADYDRTHYSGDGGSINTSEMTDWWACYNITLSAAGLNWINKQGTTKLMLRSSREIVGNDPPCIGTNNLEEIWLLSYLYGSGKEPKLYLNWLASGPPEVTTLNPNYVTVDSARLRGYLDWDGGELTFCGFSLREFPAGPVTAFYTGNYSTGATFTDDATGLKWGTHYWYTTLAQNSQGVVNGSWVHFNTSSTLEDPSDLTLIPSTCSINLSWVKGGGATNTIIRYQTGSCPLTNTSGEIAYNGSNTYFVHTGLDPGTTYYYNAWSYGKGNLSPNGSGCEWITTLAGSCETNYPSGGTGTSWFASPDYTRMSNFPGYGIINNIADTMHLPYGTMWLLLTAALITIGGFFIYSRTHHLLIAAVFILVFTALGGWFELLPYWMCLFFALGAIGMAWKELT